MIDERLEEQASLYALGALSAAESREFENALRADTELRQLVANLRGASGALAGTAPSISPPPALKHKILNCVEPSEKIVPLPSRTEPMELRQPVVWLPWALAACLAVVCAALVSRQNTLRARLDEINQLAVTLQSATNNLQHAIIALEETNRIANLRIAMLDSKLADQPKAVAVSLWDSKNQNGVFVVENLKPLPPNKDYQLWIIDPQYGTPVDAGVFQVDEKGNVRIQFKAKLPIKSADKFAVTEEAKGGSPTPHLESMVLIGG